MNPNFISHLFNDHNAEISVDREGRFIIKTDKFEIPAALEQILRPFAKHINECWFCVLKDFDKLNKDHTLQIEFSLIEKNIKHRTPVKNLKEQLVKMGYFVHINQEIGQLVFMITKDRTVLKKTQFLYKNS